MSRLLHSHGTSDTMTLFSHTFSFGVLVRWWPNRALWYIKYTSGKWVECDLRHGPKVLLHLFFGWKFNVLSQRVIGFSYETEVSVQEAVSPPPTVPSPGVRHRGCWENSRVQKQHFTSCVVCFLNGFKLAVLKQVEPQPLKQMVSETAQDIYI